MSNANNTKVNCCLTGCKYNSACCASKGEGHCTLKQIDLIIDSESGIMDCRQYEYDYNKPYACIDCQIDNFGEVDITPEPDLVFIEVDDLDDLF